MSSFPKMLAAIFALPLAVAMLWQGGPGQTRPMDSKQKEETRRVPAGVWGGTHIGLEVTEKGGRLDYDCAHGSIDQPIRLDKDGRFEVTGRHIKERGGPQREDADTHGQPARYDGRVDGATMTLTVTLTDTQETVGTFTLTRGKPPRIRKCL
jgi:hypothetical protein